MQISMEHPGMGVSRPSPEPALSRAEGERDRPAGPRGRPRRSWRPRKAHGQQEGRGVGGAGVGFGISRDPAARWSPPWYLESIVKKGEEPKLRLRIEALWGIPPAWLDGAAPGQPGGSADPLARWRRALGGGRAPPPGGGR